MKDTNTNHDTLLRLMRHPAVKAHIEPATFHGLDNHGKIDHAIHAVEEAASLLPFDRALQSDLQTIMGQSQYKLYFSHRDTNSSSYNPSPDIRHKNPAYKSSNGF